MQKYSKMLVLLVLATKISSTLLRTSDPQTLKKCKFIDSPETKVVLLSYISHCLAWFDAKPWQSGQKNCQKYQAKFPQPKNKEENDGLLAFLKENNSLLNRFYLDMTDPGQTGNV